MSVTRNTLYNQMLDMTGTRRRHDDNEREEAEMLREFLYEEPIIMTIRWNWAEENLVDIPDGVVLWRTPIMFKKGNP